MRITPVQADVNVGANYPARGIPASAFQSGAGAAGIEIARGAEDIGRLYQQKAHQDAQAEGIFLQSQAELALQNSDAALRATETDGPKYLEARRKQFQDVIQQVGSTAKNPGAQRVFNAHMQRSLVTMNGHALNYAADLTSKAEVAQLSTTIENYDNLLNGTSPYDTASITDITAKKNAAIMLRATALGGVDKATTLAKNEQHKTLAQVAGRHEKSDPEDFLKNADRYYGMDGKTLDSLLNSATDRIESRRKSHNAEMEKMYAQIEKDAEEERKHRLVDLHALAQKGDLTIAQLDDEKSYRTFSTPAEYDVLHKIITEDKKEAPSHPATLEWVQMRTRTAFPRITEATLDALKLAGKLNTKDWEAEKGKLLGRLDHNAAEGRAERGEQRALAAEQRSIAGEARTAESLRRTLKNADVTQAEQKLKADLDLHGPEDKWNLKDKQLYRAAFDEFTARAYQGNEDPIKVVREIRERYAEIRASQIKMDVVDYRRALPVVLQTETSDEAVRLLDQLHKSGGVNTETRDAYRATILDWRRRESQGLQMGGGTTSGGSAAPKPSGGSTAPKPLRPAGTPTESGR